MLNKDVVHPKMKRYLLNRIELIDFFRIFRRIENPRIILLDCSLEYKKGESQTSLEFSGEPDFTYVYKILFVVKFYFNI
jgi:T-complex protein 1 subunit gamma